MVDFFRSASQTGKNVEENDPFNGQSEQDGGGYAGVHDDIFMDFVQSVCLKPLVFQDVTAAKSPNFIGQIQAIYPHFGQFFLRH